MRANLEGGGVAKIVLWRASKMVLEECCYESGFCEPRFAGGYKIRPSDRLACWGEPRVRPSSEPPMVLELLVLNLKTMDAVMLEPESFCLLLVGAREEQESRPNVGISGAYFAALTTSAGAFW